MSTGYLVLPDILLLRWIPHVEEIIGDHQCIHWPNLSTIDHIFCIQPILEKKWKYNESVNELSIAFKKTFDSFRREALCNIMIEFGIPMKLIRQLKCIWMKRVAESGEANMCPTFLPLGMFWNKKMLYRHCFWSLLSSTPLRRSRLTRMAWNWMVHISFWFMLMLIYWAEAYIVLKKHRRFSSFWGGQGPPRAVEPMMMI